MTAFKLDELAREAEVAPRTIRYYVQRGLLPAPNFRGKDTTYDEGHLLRLRAIRRLQQAYLPLDEIQVRLRSASPEELARLASGAGTAAVAQFPDPYRRAPERPPAPPPLPSPAREVWERIALGPGLELLVRTDARPDVLEVAREIQTLCRQRI